MRVDGVLEWRRTKPEELYQNRGVSLITELQEPELQWRNVRVVRQMPGQPSSLSLSLTLCLSAFLFSLRDILLRWPRVTFKK